MKRILILTVGFLIAMFLTGCEQEQTQQEPVVRSIKMLTIGEAKGGNMLVFPGVVSASHNTELAFKVSGQIIEFNVKAGQNVEKGTLLARLDPHDYQADLDIKTADLKAAKADYDRFKELFEQGFTSQQQFEKITRTYETSQAALKTSMKALDDTNLRAPYGGNIASKIASNFQNVQAKQAVLVLHDVTALEVVVSIPEGDLVQGDRQRTMDEITAAIKPKVILSSLNNQEFPAELKEITTRADPTTRTYSATFVFHPPENINVLPGMTARVTVFPQRGQFSLEALKVPVNVVAADETGQSYVWIVDPNTSTVMKREVEVGQLTGTEITILAGLSTGETIALTGIAQLREGLKVKPLEN